MNQSRKVVLACLAAASLLALQPALSAPSRGSHSGGPAGARGGPAHASQHAGNSRGRGYNGNYGHSGRYRHYGAAHWGWGLGLAIGVPWSLGWYDPYLWGPGYYQPYAYGPAYGGYVDACALDEDCWRERMAPSEPAAPTTQVVPAVPGEEGGPTQRPLHLNYCDSAGAWYPYVRTCPGGWRLIRPEYNRAP